MEPMPRHVRRNYFYLLSLLFVAMVPLIALYTSGYRLGPNFTLVETGGIYIHSPESGTEILLDNKPVGKTSLLDRDIFIQNVRPGKHTVVLSKEGFWPWGKEIEIEEKKVAEALGFLIPKNILGTAIPKNLPTDGATSTPLVKNPLYTEVALLFSEQEKTPRKATTSPLELISEKGRVGIYRDGNKIYAQWLGNERLIPQYYCSTGVCKETIFVFDPLDTIRSFDFYPGREDVLVLAVGNGIYALEIDTRPFQNFQPLYKGVSPLFITTKDDFFVSDAGNFFTLDI